VRPQQEIDLVVGLFSSGLTATESARATGIPRSTVKDWRNGRKGSGQRDNCPTDSLGDLNGAAYADILGLFAAACERPDVRYTRPSWKQIAVYRKAAVARLDEFIGPKS